MPSTPARSSSKDDYPLQSLSKRTSFTNSSMAEVEDESSGSGPPTPGGSGSRRGGGYGGRKGKKRLSDVDAAKEEEEESLLVSRLDKDGDEDEGEYESSVSICSYHQLSKCPQRWS